MCIALAILPQIFPPLVRKQGPSHLVGTADGKTSYHGNHATSLVHLSYLLSPRHFGAGSNRLASFCFSSQLALQYSDRGPLTSLPKSNWNGV